MNGRASFLCLEERKTGSEKDPFPKWVEAASRNWTSVFVRSTSQLADILACQIRLAPGYVSFGPFASYLLSENSMLKRRTMGVVTYSSAIKVEENSGKIEDWVSRGYRKKGVIVLQGLLDQHMPDRIRPRFFVPKEQRKSIILADFFFKR